MIICYDNTFEGLLSALYTYYTTGAESILASSSDLFLLDTQLHQTNMLHAAKTRDRLLLKFGVEVYENIYYAFIYDAIDKENSIIEYINSLINKNICYNEAMHKIYSYKRAIINAINRYHGFLRFIDIGGFLYAKYEPAYDITILLTDFFDTRLGGSTYMIHDLSRSNLLLYKDKQHVLINLKHNVEIDYNEDETYIQTLYQAYFENISIKERQNYSLQRSLFPLKYRNHAIEFDGFRNKKKDK
jgi:probable DNA metabolism protein